MPGSPARDDAYFFLPTSVGEMNHSPVRPGPREQWMRSAQSIEQFVDVGIG
jgi:hypothetical protein